MSEYPSFHGVTVFVYKIFDPLDALFLRLDVPHNYAMISKCSKQEVA